MSMREGEGRLECVWRCRLQVGEAQERSSWI